LSWENSFSALQLIDWSRGTVSLKADTEGDEAREIPQPPVGSAGRRSVGHHVGNPQRHFPSFA